MSQLPFELWSEIFKYLDLKNLSKINCLNKYFNYFIQKDKLDIIDSFYTKNFLFIPKTRDTYINYYYCIDWTKFVLNNMTIPEHVIRWITERNDLEMIALHQELSPCLVEYISDRVQFDTLITKQKIPLQMLEYKINSLASLTNFQWYLIWSSQNVDYDFIIRHFNNIQWQPLSTNKDAMSYKIIHSFSENLIWPEITRHGIHECIINEFKHKMDRFCWINISEYTNLSQEFIKENLHVLDFNRVIRYQTLDEDFIIDIVDNLTDTEKYMYINIISLNQKISIKFLKKYVKFISLRTLIRNDKILRKDIESFVKSELEVLA